MEFLDLIYGSTEGYISIVTRNDVTGLPDSERWLEWPKERTFAQRYTQIREQEDVYLSVGVFRSRSRTNTDAFARSNVVWADADTCHPTNFRLRPSIIVETSPGHWHCWWVLDNDVPLVDAEKAARLISRAHRDQGCDRGWNASRILRVPGTTNTKYDPPVPVVAEYTGSVYSLNNILDSYGDVPDDSVVLFDGEIPDLIDGPALVELENQYVTSDLERLYVERPPEGESWYNRLFRLEVDLFRNGATAQEVFSLASNAACNKYARDRRKPLDLWKDVQKAHHEFEQINSVVIDSDTPRVVQTASFLSDDERALIADNPTFIDRYVAWAKNKSPDSAETYHRTFAFLVLSAVFSDKVFVNLRWGRIYPNLWALVLGHTTLSRKSTAMRFFLDLVHGVEDSEGETIDIGNDVTIEGLVPKLGARDGQVSLVTVDEVAGFFKEAYVKNFRAGTLEQFTKLYDGSVPVVLRATKGSGNTKRARTRFMFVGMGIREDVSKILTRQHFESGFLGRMVWAVADPPPYTEGTSNIEQVEPTHEGVFDPVMVDLIADLADRRADFMSTSLLRFEDDALARINTFTHAMQVYMISSDMQAAAVERLRDSVVKAATLLAAYMGQDEITLFEVLVAIDQGERWFNDMVRMMGEVSSSDFGRTLDEVEKFIATGRDHQQSEAAVFKKFTFRPAEYTEIITTLQKSGRVRYVPNDRNKLEALL